MSIVGGGFFGSYSLVFGISCEVAKSPKMKGIGFRRLQVRHLSTSQKTNMK